ncbi:MAG: patatin-like phospholipase family protein [Akkermansiaceae bacterium]|nr:patatin-like phospholipase family protein [Armatimonadota bacterium]
MPLRLRPVRALPLFLLTSILLSCTPAPGQERQPIPAAPGAVPVTPPAPVVGRKRIGIAFAGGSAYGETHIGVLKWLEEHHIPVDYVAGTSMGGLVGGAYACGYAPVELQALLSRVDWQNALRGDTPYPALTFRRKEDRRVIPNRFDFGLKNGLTLPGGLNPAHAIGLLLSEIAYPCSTVTSFDDLPIPFRCVATDLQTGESVVMKDGSLPIALRATMSLPGIFTPVRRDGRLLADGGVVQNLPTEVVRDMGAETIIAVDLNASGIAESTESLGSILTIVGRSVTLAVRANEQASLKLANIVIAPDLKGMSGNDFTQIEEFVKRGYAAAEAQKDALLPLAVGDSQWESYTAARKTRRGEPLPRPAYLSVIGPTGENAQRIVRQLRPILFRPFPSESADERFTLLTGGGRYNAVLYEGVRNIQGVLGVRIRAQETEFGPPFLRAGLEINGSDPRSVQVNLAARYIGLDAGFPGAETRLDVRLGSNVQVVGEYLLPIGGSESPFFVAPRAFFVDNSRNVFQNGSRTAVYGTEETGAAFDTALIPNRFLEVRAGYQYSYFRSGLRTGTALPATNGKVESFRVRGTYDGVDDGVLPRNGSRVTALGTRYTNTPSGNRAFSTAEIRYDAFHTRAERDTTFVLVSGGTSFGDDVPAPLQFGLGGPFRLGSENTDALRGTDFFLATGGVLRQIAAPPLLGGRTLVGVWGELGGTFGVGTAAVDDGVRGSLSAGVISETFLGPLLIGASLGDNGRGGVRLVPYFALGRLF